VSSARPVLSVVDERRNARLIAEAARLWIHPGDIVVDVTYGRGLFWKRYRPEHLICHDLYKLDGVDCRALPEADSSVNVVVLDPPYTSPGGRKTSTIPDFNDRYGLDTAPKRAGELDDLIVGGIAEAARILKPGVIVPKRGQPITAGRLMVKTMNYVTGGRYHQGHKFVIQAAEDAGLEQLDEFIHLSGTGAQPRLNADGTVRRQLHSRRSHTLLCVFALEARKPPAKVPASTAPKRTVLQRRF
jgi:hypothetical protein